jgi:AcrR family transcriptional regulator
MFRRTSPSDERHEREEHAAEESGAVRLARARGRAVGRGKGREDSLARANAVAAGPGGAPRNKRGQSREAVLQAALTVFAERGFKGATVREIARLARVNHATIRYHYETKDKLWRAAVSFLFERQVREIDIPGLAAAGLDDRDLLRQTLERYVRYSARHPEHARIAVQESILGGARLRWMSREYIRTFHAGIGPFLERSMRKGLIRETNPTSLLYVLALASQSVFLLDQEVRAVHGIDVFTPAFVDEHVRTVLRLILE